MLYNELLMSLHFFLVVAPALTEISATSTTISLSWEQGGHPVDRYRVSYTYTIRECRSEPVTGGVEIEDGNVTSFTLTGLEEDSDYTIELTAIRRNRYATSSPTHIDTRKAGVYQ